MVDVDDVNGARRQLEREFDNLEEADIDDRDRTAIRRFVEYRRDGEQRALTTLISDVGNLRRASERASTPLVEMNLSAVNALLARLTAPKPEGGYGLSPDSTTMYGYKRVLRIFFRWLDDMPDRPPYEFWDRIELPSGTLGTVDEEYSFSEDEIAALKRHAERPRDRALIDFLADVCGRITLVTQLRVGDIHNINTKRPYYTPNDDGVGQKGVPIRRYPIADSRAELRVYLNRWHRDPRDEAPLFHLLDGHYDPENPSECAVSPDRIRDMLRECTDRADLDIERHRVHPHNFRHAGLSRLSAAGHPPQVLSHVAGFTDDKMRMASYYDHTTDRRRNEEIYSLAGYIDEPGDGLETPTTESKSCGNCGERLAADERFCPRCGVASDESAGERIEAFKHETRDKTVEEDDTQRRRVLQKIAEATGLDPGEVESALN